MLDINLLHETKIFLFKHFEIKDIGEASLVIGIQINHDRSCGIICLSHKEHVERILSRFSMQNCAFRDVPIAKGDRLS